MVDVNKYLWVVFDEGPNYYISRYIKRHAVLLFLTCFCYKSNAVSLHQSPRLKLIIMYETIIAITWS